MIRFQDSGVPPPPENFPPAPINNTINIKYSIDVIPNLTLGNVHAWIGFSGKLSGALYLVSALVEKKATFLLAK